MPLTADAINQILPFAPEALEEAGDLLTLADYQADTMRKRGFRSGLARRNLFNRAHRQSAHMAAGLAQFIANRYAPGVVDDADLDKVEEGLKAAIESMVDVSGFVPNTRTITVTAPLTGGGDLSANRALGISAATETAKGAVELATAAETSAGTDTTRAVHPAGLAARWAQSHGETGWQRLPSGLMFQWGKVAGKATAGDGSHTIIFPVAFPGAAYAAHWTVGQGGHTNFNIAPGIKDLSTTGVTLMIDKDSNHSTTIDMYWFAYGK